MLFFLLSCFYDVRLLRSMEAASCRNQKSIDDLVTVKKIDAVVKIDGGAAMRGNEQHLVAYAKRL